MPSKSNSIHGKSVSKRWLLGSNGITAGPMATVLRGPRAHIHRETRLHHYQIPPPLDGKGLLEATPRSSCWFLPSVLGKEGLAWGEETYLCRCLGSCEEASGTDHHRAAPS